MYRVITQTSSNLFILLSNKCKKSCILYFYRVNKMKKQN